MRHGNYIKGESAWQHANFALQRMNFEETGSHQKSPRGSTFPSAQGHFTFHWQLFLASLAPSLEEKTPSSSLLLLKPLSHPISAKNLTTRKRLPGYTQSCTPQGEASWGRRKVGEAALPRKVQPRCTRPRSPLGLSQGLSEKKKNFFFWVLISSNKNNEFLKPTRM